jgi:ribosomal protein S18 acetylase RimI-like enzyme
MARVRHAEPNEVVDFCAGAPVERVFLDELARMRLGRFVAVAAGKRLTAVCHLGANVVPSGEGCAAFAPFVARSRARMVVGDERAVSDLWTAASELMPPPREDRPGQPVYVIVEPPPPGHTALREARRDDVALLVPACAAAHAEELGIDPLSDDGDAFRSRVLRQVDWRRSWLWCENGIILFKAEASAWTPHAVQLGQVWVDPAARGHGYARRGLRDLCRLLLGTVPVVCLFVRSDNMRAIRLYDAIGMRRVSTYRTILCR